MRVGYLIGALGAGGSERQLSELAVGMAERGHQVEVCCYDGPGVFDRQVEGAGVPVRHLAGGSKLAKRRAVRQWAESFRPQVMHGFMKRASSLAILTNLPRRRCRVVASDLSTATYSRHKPVLWASLVLFGLADRVATQTEKNRRSLTLLAPWLRRKTVVVRNGVDTERFQPVAEPPSGPLRFVAVGSVYRVKNPVAMVEAVALLRERAVQPFRLDWYGRVGTSPSGEPSEEHGMAMKLVRERGLEGIVVFQGHADRIQVAYQQAHALVHVSVQEGIPNAVVEGMACGLPLVVSRVSDLPLMVQEGRNGFVCDERRPDRIAEAMGRMLVLDEQERRAMGARSRELAVRWFGRERFVTDYENLYADIVRHH